MTVYVIHCICQTYATPKTSAYRYQVALHINGLNIRLATRHHLRSPTVWSYVEKLLILSTSWKRFCLPDKCDTTSPDFIAYKSSICTSYNPLCFHLLSSLLHTSHLISSFVFLFPGSPLLFLPFPSPGSSRTIQANQRLISLLILFLLTSCYHLFYHYPSTHRGT